MPSVEDALGTIMKHMSQSPFGLWHASHRARITLGISAAESEANDTDGSIRWELLAPLVTQTVFYAAKQSWLGKSGNRDAEIFVLKIMHNQAANIAVQLSNLEQNDLLLLLLSPMPEFEQEFQFSENPVDFEIGSLTRDAENAIGDALKSPGGQAFFNQSSNLIKVFWDTGHPNDARKIADHFKPMLSSVV